MAHSPFFDLDRVREIVFGAHHLFRSVTKDDITRPTGEIDVLIGFEYAGFHPQ